MDSKNFKSENKTLKGAFSVTLVLVTALSFVVKGHPYFSFEELPGFYSLVGLSSTIFIIAVAKTLGKLWLKKKENYYE